MTADQTADHGTRAGPPRKHGKFKRVFELTPELLESITARRELGDTWAEIASDLGIGRRILRDRLAEHKGQEHSRKLAERRARRDKDPRTPGELQALASLDTKQQPASPPIEPADPVRRSDGGGSFTVTGGSGPLQVQALGSYQADFVDWLHTHAPLQVPGAPPRGMERVEVPQEDGTVAMRWVPKDEA